MFARGQRNDSARLFSYGEKSSCRQPPPRGDHVAARERLGRRHPARQPGKGSHRFATGSRLSQVGRARRRPIAPALGRSCPCHARLCICQAGQNSSRHSRVPNGGGTAERTRRCRLCDRPRSPGMGLGKNQQNRGRQSRARRSRRNTWSTASALPRLAEQGQHRPF
jgi:hypothetical protein